MKLCKFFGVHWNGRRPDVEGEGAAAHPGRRWAVCDAGGRARSRAVRRVLHAAPQRFPSRLGRLPRDRISRDRASSPWLVVAKAAALSLGKPFNCPVHVRASYHDHCHRGVCYALCTLVVAKRVSVSRRIAGERRSSVIHRWPCEHLLGVPPALRPPAPRAVGSEAPRSEASEVFTPLGGSGRSGAAPRHERPRGCPSVAPTFSLGSAGSWSRCRPPAPSPPRRGAPGAHFSASRVGRAFQNMSLPARYASWGARLKARRPPLPSSQDVQELARAHACAQDSASACPSRAAGVGLQRQAQSCLEEDAYSATSCRMPTYTWSGLGSDAPARCCPADSAYYAP